MVTAAREMIEVTSDGKMRYHFHKGQWRAWESLARFVAVIAGTQSGKTVFGPPWLYREMQLRGPGDYMVASPSFELLKKKALPEFKHLFITLLDLGSYNGSDHIFTFDDEGMKRTFGDTKEAARAKATQVFFGHAANPESLESATIKGLWADEPGQKRFRLDSWRALNRRMAVYVARALLTTTPYNLGWLKIEIVDKAKRGDPDYDVINFPSIENPTFSKAEYERAREDLPDWLFDMFYNGLLRRPAGQIYDCFDDERDVIEPFDIPDAWVRLLGLDFGGVNTAGLFVAENPDTEELIVYREYHAGGRTAKQHTNFLLQGEPMKNGVARVPRAVGGAGSEDQWRNEFGQVGLHIEKPRVSEVEVGINRVYGQHKRHAIKVFRTCTGYLEQKATYSRVVDDRGQVGEGIEDKETFHFMDAERYIVSQVRSASVGSNVAQRTLDSMPIYEVH